MQAGANIMKKEIGDATDSGYGCDDRKGNRLPPQSERANRPDDSEIIVAGGKLAGAYPQALQQKNGKSRR